MRIFAFTLLALGVVGILISLLLLGFAALGFLGVLADVGPTENREMGTQSLSWGLPTLIGGVLLRVLGILALAWTRRRTDAEPGAVADRGRT